MSLVLLDTNIVSFIIKGDSRATLYAPHLLENEAAVSLMTVAELYQWAYIHRWGERRTRDLEQHLLRSYTIISVDLTICRLWGEVRAMGQRIGRSISPQDAWIAATAKRYGISLITHNPADFEPIEGLAVISEIK